MTGRVSYLGQFFGFLRADDGRRLFFHGKELFNVAFNGLQPCARLWFDVESDYQGRPTAVRVSVIGQPEAWR